MAEREYVRDDIGRFSETGSTSQGAAKKTAAREVAGKSAEQDKKALSRYTAIRKSTGEEKKSKLAAFVAEETPKPPKDAAWQGEDTAPDGEVTWHKYFEGKLGDVNAEVIDPERAALHEAIKDHFIGRDSKPPEGQRPVAIVMMGGAGSGKSTLIKGVDKQKYVHVDPDGIKEKIPEFRDGVAEKVKSTAYRVHEESGYVAKKLRNYAIEEGRNIIMDGTGGDAAKYGAFMDDLKNKGYQVHLMFSHLPVEKAMPRVASRAEETGRYVPDVEVRRIHDNVPKNWEVLSAKADVARMFDTDVPLGTPPRLIASREGKNEVSVKDEAFYSQFKKRYGQ